MGLVRHFDRLFVLTHRMLGMPLKSGIRTMSSQSETVLIVGLGNHDLPGTRHSIGMMLLDDLRAMLDIRWTRDRGMKAFCARTNVPLLPELDSRELPPSGCLDIVLLKPTIPMNINGQSVSAAVKHFDVPPKNVYIIHDEMKKTTGKFTIKEGGSAGGHNGVKSVCNSLRTQDFPRLRIGIDQPSDRGQMIDYALSRLSIEETRIFNKTKIPMIASLLHHIEQSLSLPHQCLVELVSRTEKG